MNSSVFSVCMVDAVYFSLVNKKVLLVTGKVERLLKGITTNTLDAPMNAFINQFGKIEVLFAQTFVGDHAYLVLEEQFVDRLRVFLEKYLRLARATIMDSGLNVYHVMGSVDESYGYCIPQRIGYLVLAQDTPPLEAINEEVYTALRVENNMSVQGVDFDQEMILNTNWKDVASLTKGCYLGQEVVARVANLGKPPKKMIRVLLAEKKETVLVDGVSVPITSLCYSQERKKWMGFCMVKNEDVSLEDASIFE
jgi:folate-binding protein YgfZ